MPEEISDTQFKAEMLEFKTEMLRFVNTAAKKFDGLTADVRTNSFKLDRLEMEFGNGLDRLGTEVGNLTRKSEEHDKRFDLLDEKFAIQHEQIRILDTKIDDVASKVIEIDKRMTVVEAKLSLMETKLTSLEDEARQIRLEMNELNERIENTFAFREQIDQLEVRVFQLEEKLTTDH